MIIVLHILHLAFVPDLFNWKYPGRTLEEEELPFPCSSSGICSLLSESAVDYKV